MNPLNSGTPPIVARPVSGYDHEPWLTLNSSSARPTRWKSKMTATSRPVSQRTATARP
jgi:hypothetical protein